MCLAQEHNSVTPVKLEPAAPYFRVKHSTTEPLRLLMIHCISKEASMKAKQLYVLTTAESSTKILLVYNILVPRWPGLLSV